jgi:hypothetical protein
MGGGLASEVQEERERARGERVVLGSIINAPCTAVQPVLSKTSAICENAIASMS